MAYVLGTETHKFKAKNHKSTGLLAQQLKRLSTKRLSKSPVLANNSQEKYSFSSRKKKLAISEIMKILLNFR